MNCLKNFICEWMKKVKSIIDSTKKFILQTLALAPSVATPTPTHFDYKTTGIYRLAARVLVQYTFDLCETNRLNELLFEECSCENKSPCIPLFWLLLAKVEHKLYNYKNLGWVTISSPQIKQGSNVVLQALLEVGFSLEACERLLQYRKFELSVFPPDHLKYKVNDDAEWKVLCLKDYYQSSDREPLKLDLPKIHCVGGNYHKREEVQRFLKRVFDNL